MLLFVRLLAVMLLTILAACSKYPVLVEQFPSPLAGSARISEDEGQTLRKEFVIALAKAMTESKKLRFLIRLKALEMYDEDNDVLFALIRDEELEPNLTVKELLAKHLKSMGRLNQIEKALPTLTIFVPTLPQGSFSPLTWNTETVNPLVGIKSIKSDNVAVVDAEGTEAILEAKYAPGFPIVVVKNSLRVIDDSQLGFDKLNSKSRLVSSNGRTYKFLDDNFDRKLKAERRKGARYYADYQLEDKIKSAYLIFPNSDNWQRDYIYFDLTPSTTRGTFKYQFKEALTMFSLSRTDPMGAFHFICDATDGSDPTFQTSTSTNQSTFWTGSSFTFRIHVLYSAKQEALGTEYTTLFPILASDLFDVQYDTITFPGFWPWQRRYVYVPRAVTTKQVDLRQELFNWDTSAFSGSILIKFEEVDTPMNFEQTVTNQAKFSINYDVNTGEKVGLKFGVNGETSRNVSTKVTYQEGSDDLGSAIMNFGDNIILGNVITPGPTMYNVREYSTGWCIFTISPVQVQP